MKTIIFAITALILPMLVHSSTIADQLKIQPVKVTIADLTTFQTTIDQNGVNNLYDRFVQHYGEFLTGINTRKVDFGFFMYTDNIETRHELFRLFHLALKQGFSMDVFADFGLTPQGEKTYTYNYKPNNLHLITPSFLFSSISRPSDLKMYSQRLLKAGLRPDDLKKLNEYLKKIQKKIVL